MIKLFWNTHNQKKTNTDDEKIKKLEDQNYAWGLYHKKNSGKWVYEILKKVNYDIIENDVEKVKQYINQEVPLRSFIMPKEIISIIDMLISDKNSNFTGSDFIIDGGQSI